jgi:hypothetical protein
VRILLAAAMGVGALAFVIRKEVANNDDVSDVDDVGFGVSLAFSLSFC